MADDRRIELDDLLVRPGTYLNPQTEVLIVVDDSPSIDGEIFNMEEFEGAETFQATYQGGDGRDVPRTPPDDDPGEVEPDPEQAGFTAEE